MKLITTVKLCHFFDLGREKNAYLHAYINSARAYP